MQVECDQLNRVVFPALEDRLLERSTLGGTCIACFPPALVFHPRRGKRYKITAAAGDNKTGIEEM
jgi:hypothetical protein